jgi:nicotinic acid mononucleotide adenylyltransferase
MGAFGSYLKLTEAKRVEGAEPKTAVFTFGRFNPPTKGHAKLIATVERIAKEIGGDPYIFVSRSHDRDKNPLTFEDKLVFMRKIFPDTNIIENDQIKNPFNASGFLGSHLKYTDIVLVAGSDRVGEYEKRFSKPDKYFDSFKVVSAGERDPDSDDIIGMSGTKARAAAARNDLGAFRAATGWEGELSLEMMRAIQRGMQNG